MDQTAEESDSLERLRQQVDKVDVNIIALLAERRAYSLAEQLIGAFSATDDPDEHRAIIRALRQNISPIMADRVLALVCELLSNHNGVPKPATVTTEIQPEGRKI